MEANQLAGEYFPEVEKMEAGALHQRREEILQEAGGVHKMSEAPDHLLAELIAVNRRLRKLAAAPSGGGRKKASPRPTASIDSLA